MKRFLSVVVIILALAATGIASWPAVYPEVLAGDQLDYQGVALYRQIRVENIPWSQPDPPSMWIVSRIYSSPEAITLVYGRSGASITAPWDPDCQCYLLLEGDASGGVIKFESFTVEPESDPFLVTMHLGTFYSTGSIGPWWDFDTTRMTIVSELIQGPAAEYRVRRATPNRRK